MDELDEPSAPESEAPRGLTVAPDGLTEAPDTGDNEIDDEDADPVEEGD